MKKLKLLTLAYVLCTIHTIAFTARTTSYAAQEDGNYLNCSGSRLQVGQVAADLRYYPLGTTLVIDGARYVVSDCGSAVRGKYHFDVYCRSLREMNQRGTHISDVRIVSTSNANSGRVTSSTRLTNPRVGRLSKNILASCARHSNSRPRVFSPHANGQVMLCLE